MRDHTKPETIATFCQTTGRHCATAACAADRLACAAGLACAAAPCFTLQGQLRLEGCAQGCDAQFILDKARVELFCGVDADVDLAALRSFADSFLDTGEPLYRLGTPTAAPRAMVRSYVSGAPHPATSQIAMTG